MTAEQRTKFLYALMSSPNVSAACRAADLPRQTAYDHRKADPEFAAAWDDAIDASTDALVGEAYRRAFEGTDEPVFYQGEQCGTVKKHSDTLAIFLLKAHRPQVYRETVRQEVTGADGGPVQNVVFYLPSNGRDDDGQSPPA